MLNPNYGGECFFWSILIFLMNRENFHEGQPNPIEQNKVLDCERAYIVVKILEIFSRSFLALHYTTAPAAALLFYELWTLTRVLLCSFHFF